MGKVTQKGLYLMQKGLCFYCEKRMTIEELTQDHFFPKAAGFDKWGGMNIVYACEPCNQAKGARLPTMEELERFLALINVTYYRSNAQRKFVAKVKQLHEQLKGEDHEQDDCCNESG